MKTTICIALILLVFGCSGSSDVYIPEDGNININRIVPSQDLVYEGAFKIPTTDNNGTNSSFAGWAMAFDPTGNGGSGSLFISCNWNHDTGVAEISIPTPNFPIAKTADDLNSAVFLQNCTDNTGGYMTESDSREIMGLLRLSPQGQQTKDKLYTVVNIHYTVSSDFKTIGWSETDLSIPNPQGWWHVAPDTMYTASHTSQYMLEIENRWAELNKVGILGVGRSRGQSSGSRGPSLFAIRPWDDGNPPADNSTLTYSVLLSYPNACEADKSLDLYSNGESARGAAWLSIGNKQSFVVYNQKNVRLADECKRGLQTYGYGTVDADGDGVDETDYPSCEINGGYGYTGSPRYNALQFYDVNDLSAVIADKMQTWEPQPYAYFNLKQYEINPDPLGGGVYEGGMAYDRSGQMLFIVEMNPWKTGESVVHVFSVQDIGTQEQIDKNPPTIPTGLSWNATTRTLNWNASTDPEGNNIYYIIYRRQAPRVGFYPTGISHRSACIDYPINTDCFDWEAFWLQDLVTTGEIYRGTNGSPYPFYYYTVDDSVVYQDYPISMTTSANKTSWTDIEYDNAAWFGYHAFRVSAIDENGNESGLSELLVTSE